MATRSKGGWWEVYYRDPVTKKQRTRTFKTKREAEKEDRRVKYMLEFDRQALIEEDAARVKVPEKPAKPEPPEPPKPDPKDQYTILSVLEQTIDWYGLRDSARLADKTWIRDARAVARELGENTDIRAVDTRALAVFYQKCAARGVKPQSVRRSFRTFKRVLTVALNLGFIDEMPAMPKTPQPDPTRYVPYTEDEISALYKAASPHLKRVILLGARFGMRVGSSEILALKWSDVDTEAWVIRLRAARKNKSALIRVLPIPEPYRALFARWREEDERAGFAYVCHNSVGKAVARIDWETWHSLLKKAGIDRPARAYDLRHAFATNMLRAGVPVTTVAKLMGHSNLNMLFKHYQYVGEQDKLDALSALARDDDTRMV